MPNQIYEYKCIDCDQRYTSVRRGDTLNLHVPCQSCEGTNPLKRVWAVSIQRPMMAHFNASLQMPISDMNQYKRELKRRSDEAEDYTGQAHDYQPIDPADTKALGVTGEGLDATNRVRSKAGESVIPLHKFGL